MQGLSRVCAWVIRSVLRAAELKALACSVNEYAGGMFSMSSAKIVWGRIIGCCLPSMTSRGKISCALTSCSAMRNRGMRPHSIDLLDGPPGQSAWETTPGPAEKNRFQGNQFHAFKIFCCAMAGCSKAPIV